MRRPSERPAAKVLHPALTMTHEVSGHGPLQVAILHWQTEDGIAAMLCDEVARLGHRALPFRFGSHLPNGTDVLLSFGPYGPLLPVWQASEHAAWSARPVVVHWNTEGMPDLRLPPAVIRMVSWLMSQLTWKAEATSSLAGAVYRTRGWAWWKHRTARFRYTGDYLYACRQGWLDVLADTSAVYAEFRSGLGHPTVYAPWGATPSWHTNLELPRDIDVLWMGVRGTTRRSRLLDRVFQALRTQGVNLYVADNVERPFIYGEDRTRLLNRSKITLNITRTWYDDNFSRFAMAIPNRSLVVSEPMLPHCPEYQPGVHYVSASADRLVDTLLYYLRHEEERRQIVERAYQFITTELVFQRTVARLLDLAGQRVQQRARIGTSCT